MLLDVLMVEEATLAGVTLFGEDNVYPYQLCLVGEHVYEVCMWNLNNVLIVALADVNLLFPVLILADDKRAYVLSYQQVNDRARGTMQEVIDAPCTNGRE